MADDDDEHLKELTEKLKQGLEVKDRRYRLKVYKQVFLGTDAVNFFLAEKYATNIADAVALGSELMAAGVFQHCLRDHPFKNEPLFYRFVDQDIFHGGYELGKTVLQMSCIRVESQSSRSWSCTSRFNTDESLCCIHPCSSLCC